MATVASKMHLVAQAADRLADVDMDPDLAALIAGWLRQVATHSPEHNGPSVVWAVRVAERVLEAS